MTSERQAATSGTWLWWLISLMLGLPALWMGSIALDQAPSHWPVQAQSWALHPDLGIHQPLSVWWCTGWLHGSAMHLHRNLLALGLLALLAALMGPSVRAALIWAVAWPLTHLGMLLEPALSTYIGMSGVLHAGVAIVCLDQLAPSAPRSRKLLAWALLACLASKILLENPWRHLLSYPAGSDIPVAPWAHLSGSMTGLTLYLLSSAIKRLISHDQRDTSCTYT